MREFVSGYKIYLDRQEAEEDSAGTDCTGNSGSFGLARVPTGLVGGEGKFGYSVWKAAEEFDDGTDLTIGGASGASLILPY